MMLVMTVSLAALAVTLFCYSLLSLTFAEERQVKNQMKRLSSYESSQAVAAEPMLAPFMSRTLVPGMHGLGRGLKSLAPSSYMDALRRRLLYAGSPRGLDAARLLTLQFVLASIVGGLVLVVRLVAQQTLLAAVVTALAIGAIAFLLPVLWVSHLATKRQARIRRELPDMLDMLLISVEAGLGFDAAVAKIVLRTPGPLGEEFGRMLQDGQAGLGRREALKRMAERNNVTELNAFILAMVQADVFGISVSNILRAQSHELRVKRRQRAEEMAQKAPAKMVFPLILCILPATLVVVGGPAVIAIGKAFGML
jgi:tight adherence protein C